MIWLGIDTSNSPLAVAIVKDGQVVAEEVANIKLNHSIGAMPAIERLFERAKMKPAEIDAIAVGEVLVLIQVCALVLRLLRHLLGH